MITCPHCGKPMPEEALFCESCGKERQLVPDYEAEVNQSMDETISTIAVELANTQEIVPQELARDAVIREQVYIEKTLQKEKQESEEKSRRSEEGKKQVSSEESSGEKSGEKPKENLKGKKISKGSSSGEETVYVRSHGVKPTLFLLIMSLTVVLLAAGVIAFFMKKNATSTYEYQLSQAKLYESQGDYEMMLEYARKASEIAANSSDAKMLVAKAYAGLSRTDEERIVLEGLLITDPAFTDAYSVLIPIYEKSGDYEKIAQILLSCPDQTVTDKYADYIAQAPEFSVAEGKYVEMVSVKLLATGSGTIYYTIDGSKPTEDSDVYSMPILLDNTGTYQIRAIYKNSFGIISPESSAKYEITVAIEDDSLLPEILLESGTYDSPQMIEVKAPSEGYQIYYTDNGQTPTLESRVYDKPIPMPLGDSRFHFAIFDEDGQAGQVASAEYRLEMNPGITPEQAGNLLTQALVNAGILADVQGNIATGEGRRSYRAISIIRMQDADYYLMEEQFESADGNRQRTGNYYGVNISTGQSFQVTENSAGQFSASGL
ncbi:MAG: chitobiase/beta-hexosaminidase C-terminal domain-containing protein [Lachnospiraceae bacterium]|nr:chitobiase/beta-hexosaminidase C-terminal domain-containing protein [Lachnospiraceae bacterium]